MTARTVAVQRLPRPDLPWTRVDDVLTGDGWVPAATPDRLEIVDPATEEVWGSAPDAGPDDVDACVRAAHAAFRSGPWPRTTPSQRAALLVRAADLLLEQAEPLAHTVSRENGSPLAETLGAAANAASILK